MSNLENIIQEKMNEIGKGHDFLHIQRVLQSALMINEHEKQDPNSVRILTLIHDYFDEKFYQGDFEKDFNELLKHENLKEEELNQIKQDVMNFGFKGGLQTAQLSKVGQIVSDADRLDALGAIGIARAMMYGDTLYDPNLNYSEISSKEEYRSPRPILFHFYDKLLKLKDLMFTQTGKELALDRHKFMEVYLEQLSKEIQYKVK